MPVAEKTYQPVKRVYQWKPGVCLDRANAQKVGEEIESIVELEAEEVDSFVNARKVLEKARNENTELHKCFDWDDSSAAEKHRLAQAGVVLRGIGLVILRESKLGVEQPPLVIRAWERKPDPATGKLTRMKFVHTDTMLANDTERLSLIAYSQEVINTLRKKIKNYNEAAKEISKRKEFVQIDRYLELAAQEIEKLKS